MENPPPSKSLLALALALTLTSACAACGAPASPPPSAPLSNAAPPAPVPTCTPRTIDELVDSDDITEDKILCLLPGATVRREGNRFTASLPGRPAPQFITGPLEPGLALIVGADEGPSSVSFVREIKTSLGVTVGSTLGELIAVMPGLQCGPWINTPFMACHSPSLMRFTFWTRGSGFGADEAQQAKLERHADHVVVWFERRGPHTDGDGE